MGKVEKPVNAKRESRLTQKRIEKTFEQNFGAYRPDYPSLFLQSTLQNVSDPFLSNCQKSMHCKARVSLECSRWVDVEDILLRLTCSKFGVVLLGFLVPKCSSVQFLQMMVKLQSSLHGARLQTSTQ